CCTYDRGELWIHALDDLPLLVRRRLADAHYNICPTCVAIDTCNNGVPTLKLYFAVIEAIERVLDQAERRFNDEAGEKLRPIKKGSSMSDNVTKFVPNLHKLQSGISLYEHHNKLFPANMERN